MRITDVVTTRFTLGPIDPPFHNSNSRSQFSDMSFAFVEVRTDEGLSGIAPTYARQALRPTVIARLKSAIVGSDPLDAGRLWDAMYPSPDVGAIGAIDNALWDLRGKILGLPVYRLLGGGRDRIPVYASGGYYQEGKGLDELAKEYAGFVSAGYRAVKMKVGGASLADDVARVATVRDAIGHGVGLAIDANRAWTVAQAIRFVRATEGYDLMWVEEPVLGNDPESLAELRRILGHPIASGEGEHSRWEFKGLIEGRGADIIQPDCENCGGLTEWVRIAAYASIHHLPMSPHGTHITGAHAAAAVDNGLTVEGLEEMFPWRREVIEFWPLDNGELVLPSAPGLGMVLNDDAIKRGTPF